MEVKWWKTLSISAVPNGGTGSDSYIPTEDVLLNIMMVTERGDQKLQKVFAEITHEGIDLTKGPIPCASIGTNRETALHVEKVLHRGSSTDIIVTNNLTSTVTLDFIIECLPPA